MGRPDHARLHAVVRGEVQGVGFRFHVRRAAEKAGVSGWVRNREDGSVECAAEGARPRLEELLESLRRGPAGASVEDVELTWEEPGRERDGFRIVG